MLVMGCLSLAVYWVCVGFYFVYIFRRVSSSTSFVFYTAPVFRETSWCMRPPCFF